MNNRGIALIEYLIYGFIITLIIGGIFTFGSIKGCCDAVEQKGVKVLFEEIWYGKEMLEKGEN